MPRAPAVIALTVLCLGACSCARTHTARLDDGGGLAAGAPVMVRGVRVGEVRAVSVRDGAAEVRFAIEREHDVEMHADACAVAAPSAEQPLLIVIPGESAEPLADDTPLPECRLTRDDVVALGDLFGETFADVFRALSEGLFGNLPMPGLPGLPGSPGMPGMPTAPHPAPAPPPAPPPAPAPAPSPGPTGPAPGLPPPPLPAGPRPDACEALSVRLDGTEPVGALPMVLPAGGTRVFFVFDNAGDAAVEVGPRLEAVFTDASRRTISAPHLPDATGWFMPFTVPARASHRTSVVFGPDAGMPAGVEVRRVSAVDRPFDTCTLSARL